MKRSKFTLIELVVAIAILIVVAGIIGVAGAAFYQGYERSLRVTEKLKEFMAIDNLMDTHIRNMIPFDWKDEDGNVRLLFDGEENRIFFSTLRRSYGDRPGALLFVRVFVDNEELVAEYSPYPRFPWVEEGDESMPFTREVLAKNVSSITFKYAENSTEDSGGIELLDEFREEENSVIPLAVLLKIEFTDGSSEQWFRRVAGVSRNSTFGVRENTGNSDETSGGTAASTPSVSGGSGRPSVSGGSSRPSGSGRGGRPSGSGRPGGRGGR
ncbi:MAG: hypothetical protein E7058_00095 [Lentisphaerae bacterium]|nr:hypothetical protein [Lentisphaerota bacterium]